MTHSVSKRNSGKRAEGGQASRKTPAIERKGPAKARTDPDQGYTPPVLVPQPHGGALLSGGQRGQTPGPGRPKEHIRATMRQKLDEEMIQATLEEWRAGKTTALDVAEFFARYGLGTQSETITRDDVQAEWTRGLVRLKSVVVDEWNHSIEEATWLVNEMERALRGAQ